MTDLKAWHMNVPELGAWNEVATGAWQLHNFGKQLDDIAFQVLKQARHYPKAAEQVITGLNEQIAHLVKLRDDLTAFNQNQR
ncbi:hypothetical protein [Nonomuraea sp. SYSU D8015]|uniref:hypothetical protein n=1 Tax=Nonomuraea sp. SYSU D8015 TaxID=2593644 RepID=UPI0016607D2C|nr:hypothetical protein [Nonomuraea sp. SYSU D8015]